MSNIERYHVYRFVGGKKKVMRCVVNWFNHIFRKKCGSILLNDIFKASCTSLYFFFHVLLNLWKARGGHISTDTECRVNKKVIKYMLKLALRVQKLRRARFQPSDLREALKEDKT